MRLIPLNKNGTYDLSNTTLEQIRNEYSAKILEALVRGGGQGIRDEVWELMQLTLQWQEAKLIRQGRPKG